MLTSATKACPLCGSSGTLLLLHRDWFPYFTSPMPKAVKDEIRQSLTADQLGMAFDVRACEACRHCFLASRPDADTLDELYSRHHTYPSALESGICPSRDDAFLAWFRAHAERHPLPGKSVLEVACHDGYVLHHLGREGYTVRGCDPSPGADIARRHGVPVDRRFFRCDDYLAEEARFDVVLARHFIEHVPDPASLTRELIRLLRPGGRLILETPNVLYHLENGLPEVFSLQHLHGFSAQSLGEVMSQEGLRVLDSTRTPANLILAASAMGTLTPSEPDFSPAAQLFGRKLEETVERVRQSTSAVLRHKGRLALWGAGSFGSAAMRLYGVPPEAIGMIIDSDPAKLGKEYLDLDVPVISPAQAQAVPPELIVVASMYAREICQRIRELGLPSEVLSLYPCAPAGPAA